MVISEKAGSECLVNNTNGEKIDPMNVDNIAEAIDRQMSLAAIPDLNTPRLSLMTSSFEERINYLVGKLKV